MQGLQRPIRDEMRSPIWRRPINWSLCNHNLPCFCQIGGNEPRYEDFRPRTLWSLSNAFTSAFKELDPIPQFKATAKLGAFLEERLARKF